MSASNTDSARQCGDDGVVAGRGPGQRGWYEWIATQVNGATVLDVGCGLGYGLEILRRTAASVSGQDMDERLGREDVTIQPLDRFPSKSVDIVTAVDVLEHIDNDSGFVAELARIARSRLILTTPNWTAGRGAWPYHVREYTPDQLRGLCERVGRCELWKGNPEGTAVYPIRHRSLNHLFNRARVIAITAPFARLTNLVLPEKSRIHSHLAVIVELQPR